MLSGAILTTLSTCLPPSVNLPVFASNNTLALTLVSNRSDGSDDPSDAVETNFISFNKVSDFSVLSSE